MHRRFATLAAAAAALSTQPAMAAPIPVFTAGKLTGVDNLQTSHGAYDVDWVLGTCAEVFGTLCGTVGAELQFDQNEALEATRALNDFMLTQDKTLLPGYRPETGNSLTSIATAFAIVPNEIRIGPVVRRNGERIAFYDTSVLGSNADVRSLSLLTTSRFTYATYSPAAPQAVPEPSSWLLAGVALAALGASSRQRKSPEATAPGA